jgi:TolB-like protein
MCIVGTWGFSNYHTVGDLGGYVDSLTEAILKALPKVHGILVDSEESIDRCGI